MTTPFKLAVAAGLLVLLNGCASTTAPTTEQQLKLADELLPAKFDANALLQDNPTQLSEQPDEVHWWRGFNNSVLNDLVKLTVENNRGLASRQADLKAAEANLKAEQAQSGLRIDLTGQTSARRTSGDSNSGSSGNSSRNQQSLALGLALPLDTNGEIQSQVGVAQAAVTIAKANLYGELLRASSSVVKAYLDYQGSLTQLKLLEESVRLQEETLRIVQVRFETGLSPELDVQRARTSVENLKASLAPLRQVMAESKMRIASLTATPLSEVKSKLDIAKELPIYQWQLPEMLPLTVAQSRPDVQAAWGEVLRTAYEVGVSRAALYPALNLNASLTLGIQSISGAGTLDTLTRLISLAFSQMIVDSGRSEAQVDAANARAQSAIANFEQSLLNAVESVENQLNRLHNSRQRQEALSNSVAASQRSFEQANTLYQLGLVSFLDVVDAQRVLANAQQTLAKEKTDYAKHVAGLFEALGG